MEEEKIIEKNHTFVKVLIVLLILLILGGAGYFYYAKVYNNPMTVFAKIKKLDINKDVLNTSLNINEPFKAIGNIDLNLNTTNKEAQKEVDLINKTAIQYDLAMDVNKKIVNGSINTKYDNQKLLDTNLYYENNTLYIYLQEIFDKYISMPLEITETTSESQDNYDYNKVFKCLSKNLDDVFTEEDFTREKVTIKFNGKEVKAYKNTLTINENNYKRITVKMLDNILNDSESLTELSKLGNFDAEKELSALKEAILKDDSAYNYKVTVDLYSKGITNSVFKYAINIVKDEKNSISLENTAEKDIMLTVVIDDSKAAINLETINDKNYVIKITVNEKSLGELTVGINLSIYNIQEIGKPDMKNVVKSTELTEADQQKIMENIQKNENLSSLLG